ncbi:MAG: rhomboid family intramembrane serine protease [bacterium]|jgi:membrane associated rhomboid family serine protease
MDNYRPQGFSLLPTIVKNLLIINGLFFLMTIVIQNTFQKDLTDWLALYYPGAPEFKAYQFATHLFMHGNFMHLFSNMFALWMFGSALENIWGPKKFLTYYIITGLGAAVLHTLVIYVEISSLQSAANQFFADPTNKSFEYFVLNSVPQQYQPIFVELMNSWNSNPASIELQQNAIGFANELIQVKQSIPTVGASGAVFGVLLAFGMMFPNSMIYVFFFLPMKAKYFVLLYGIFELYSGIQNNPSDNVAHFAHLGGMLFGFILIKYWRKKTNRWY